MDLRVLRLLPHLCFLLGALLLIGLSPNDACARAGGGSSGSCDGWLCILLYPIILCYSLYVGLRLSVKHRRVVKALREMAQHEPEWAEERLLAVARDKFILLQAAWGENDLDTIRSHLMLGIYNNWETQINEYKRLGRRNVMEGLSITKMRIVDAKNYRNDEHDEFTVAFDATATDRVIGDPGATPAKRKSFREFWTFEWENGEWRLREITQSDGWKRFVNAAIIYQRH